MAGYVVIAADGALTHHQETPTLERINTAVGPEGWARVKLGYPVLSGFVNDCGLLAPDLYARNPVGACVLARLGASQQPYAGPVVITGWDDNPHGDDLEIRPLGSHQASALGAIHRQVVAALEGTESGSELATGLRAYAEHVRSAPAPLMESVQVESLEDLRRLLGGDRRG
jgi:hypothetical protein